MTADTMPPSTLVFAPASRAQHDRIETLLRCAFKPYVELVGYDMTDETFDLLRPALEQGNVYVGLDGDAIVAAVVLSRHGRAFEIDFLAVDPERQGRGIGNWLLDNIERTARADGLEALLLHTAEMREDLLRIYRQHGFKETRRAPPEHGKDPHLRVHMRKDL